MAEPGDERPSGGTRPSRQGRSPRLLAAVAAWFLLVAGALGTGAVVRAVFDTPSAAGEPGGLWAPEPDEPTAPTSVVTAPPATATTALADDDGTADQGPGDGPRVTAPPAAAHDDGTPDQGPGDGPGTTVAPDDHGGGGRVSGTSGPGGGDDPAGDPSGGEDGAGDHHGGSAGRR